MKRLLLTAGLVLLLTKDAYAICAKHKDMALSLMQNGYGFAATAITDQNNVIQLYINTHDGSWIILGVDNDMQACVLVHGLQWYGVKERAI